MEVAELRSPLSAVEVSVEVAEVRSPLSAVEGFPRARLELCLQSDLPQGRCSSAYTVA